MTETPPTRRVHLANRCPAGMPAHFERLVASGADLAVLAAMLADHAPGAGPIVRDWLEEHGAPRRLQKWLRLR